MTKKLEKEFDLPSMEEALEQQKIYEHIEENTLSTPLSEYEAIEETTQESEVEDEDLIKKALTTAEKIDKALPQVKDLESHDIDMDEYATDAMKSFRELMDLGMNSEARHAGKFFEVAQTMMKNAIEAKNAKADKKLRMIELQLKKQRVDQWDRRDPRHDDVIEGEGYVVGDRNKLLDQLLDKVNENDKKQDQGDK